jgi:uncharacterized protein
MRGLITDAVAARFIGEVRQNPINAALLDRLPMLALPDCWLVAGCLFQSVWNVQSGRPAHENINDYDVFYFDGTDLSYEAEDAVIKRVATAFSDLEAKIEVKNQARVHLWYPQRFHEAYPQLTSTLDGIDRFLVCATCVGIRCQAGLPSIVYGTYGLEALYTGMLRPNPLNGPRNRFPEKAASYRSRWPWLSLPGTIEPSVQLASQPPSTTSVVPVEKLDASLAR